MRDWLKAIIVETVVVVVTTVLEDVIDQTADCVSFGSIRDGDLKKAEHK